MSAPAFTPGPWRVREPGCVTILGTRRHTHFDGTYTDFEAAVARIQPSPKREANARLIAAAPELYEALEALVASYRGRAPDATNVSLKWADAALAKARGEQ